MGNRKIAQLSTLVRDTDDGQEIILFAIANDGTLWRRNAKSGSDWKLVKNVPQSTVKGEASYKSSQHAY